jgi:FtsP/CotA-like multicopper oxidase with cupredoxin domain
MILRTAVMLFFFSLGCTAEISEVAELDVTCATPEDAAAPADRVITVQDAEIAAIPTRTFPAWTYDGDVPGPVLLLRLGESLRVKLENHSPRPASLHFHGVAYTETDDGTTDHPQGVVNPGCAHVYTIRARAVGIWPFHSHVDSRTELSQGLHGAVLVTSPEETPADRELVVFLGQLGIEEEGAGGGGEGEGAPGLSPPFFMTLNGRAAGGATVIERQGDAFIRRPGPAEASVGQLVRWHVLNLSPDDLHTFHLHGHVWCDRGGVPDAAGVCPGDGIPTDNIPLAPAVGATFEFIEDAPGEWMYHCHILDHVHDGMWAIYRVLAEKRETTALRRALEAGKGSRAPAGD